MTPGKLYLIPVSLGEAEAERYQPAMNLAVISKLSVYVVENARTARQYIKSVAPNVHMAGLTIYEIDKHNGYSYPEEVIVSLKSGRDVGLMSEAGCPAVADPGGLIVRRAHREGIEVVPLVGPSSILLSLMASGFSGQRFAFRGYLPIDERKRKAAISDMIHRVGMHDETQIFIETPYRNDKLLTELCRSLPETLSICVAVDLTTEREEIHTRTVKVWKQTADKVDLHKRPAIFLIGK